MEKKATWKSHVSDGALMAGTAIATVIVTGIVAAATSPVFGIEPWWFSIMAGAGYFINSFRKPVLPNEIGVRDLFGDITDQVGPGLHFAPRGIFGLTTLPANQIEREFPGEPEEIYHGKSDLPPGMKRPIIMPFRSSAINADEAENLIGEKDWHVLDLHKLKLPDGQNWRGMDIEDLDELEEVEIEKVKNKERGCVLTFKPGVPDDSLSLSRIESELSMKVIWQIEDAEQFIRTMDAREENDSDDGRITFANKQLEDEMVSVLSKLLPQMSYSQALQNINWINSHLFYALHKRTKGWGVKIVTAFIKPPKTPEEVSGALSTAAAKPIEAKAKSARITTIGTAEADALQKRLEAEASGEKARLTATADGLAAIADKLGVSGAEALAAETAGKLANGGNVIVAGEAGMRDLLALVAAGKKTAARAEPEK